MAAIKITFSPIHSCSPVNRTLQSLQQTSRLFKIGRTLIWENMTKRSGRADTLRCSKQSDKLETSKRSNALASFSEFELQGLNFQCERKKNLCAWCIWSHSKSQKRIVNHTKAANFHGISMELPYYFHRTSKEHPQRFAFRDASIERLSIILLEALSNRSWRTFGQERRSSLHYVFYLRCLLFYCLPFYCHQMAAESLAKSLAESFAHSLP